MMLTEKEILIFLPMNHLGFATMKIDSTEMNSQFYNIVTIL